MENQNNQNVESLVMAVFSVSHGHLNGTTSNLLPQIKDLKTTGLSQISLLMLHIFKQINLYSV